MRKDLIYYFAGVMSGVLAVSLVYAVNIKQEKFKMNLKCIQGELYEEIRTNMFVKSHLECFEQRTLTP